MPKLAPVDNDPFAPTEHPGVPSSPIVHDPLTGATAPTDAAQGKFSRITDAILGGLKNWVETPGRSMREGITTEQAVDWAAPTALGMFTMSRLPGAAPQGTVGTFAGPKSKIWDAPTAATAERMALDSAWRETGYGNKFADKKMRTEIPDKDAGVYAEFGAMTPSQTRTLPQVLSHPGLYEAYPMLRDVKVTRREGSSFYDPRTNTINVLPGSSDPRSVIIHEAQHAVDDLERFSRGASVQELVSVKDHLLGREQNPREAYRNTAGEVNARLTEARSNLPADRLRDTPPWEMFDVPIERQVHRGTTSDQTKAARNAAIGIGTSGALTVGALGNLIYQIGNAKVPVKKVDHNPFEDVP